MPSTPPLPAAALCDAYRAALYEVLGAAPVALSIDMPVAGLAAWLRDRDAASATIVTAWNPFSRALADAENATRQRALIAAVEALGLRWCAAQGRDPAGAWPPEASLCVFDAPLVEADAWLVAFDQYAAVVADDAGCRLRWHPALRGLGEGLA